MPLMGSLKRKNSTATEGAAGQLGIEIALTLVGRGQMALDVGMGMNKKRAKRIGTRA